MVMARLTSKGQITLPVEIRRKFDLVPGDEVLFSVDGGVVRLVPVKRKRLTELLGILPATRPFIGRDAIRRNVRRKRAAALLGGRGPR